MRIVVVGPHPDDQEAGMGATIAKLVSQGHDVLLLDMTNGEPTPLGDPVTRAKEWTRASEILGAPRVQLGLPNRFVEHSIEARHRVAEVLRDHGAEVVFVPFFEDAHPDHRATTRIVEDARFDAKLTRLDLRGERKYAKWLFYYYATHLRWVADPRFCIDVTGFEQKKIDAMEAYHTQFVAPGRIGTHPGGRTVADWVRSHLGYFGTRIGTMYAEPFFTKEPIGLDGLGGLVL